MQHQEARLNLYIQKSFGCLLKGKPVTSITPTGKCGVFTILGAEKPHPKKKQKQKLVDTMDSMDSIDSTD